MKFLKGLHDSYTTARGQILMMTPLPSVTQAFSLIKQDEKQKEGYNHNNTYLVALSVSTHQFKKKKMETRTMAMMMEEIHLGNAVIAMILITLRKPVLNSMAILRAILWHNKQKNPVGTPFTSKGTFHKNIGNYAGNTGQSKAMQV